MYQMELFNNGGAAAKRLFDSTTDCYKYLNSVGPNVYVKITYGQEAMDGAFEAEEVIATFWTED